MNIAVRYAGCAVVATLINLSTQWIFFRLYHGPGELVLGILSGTATGLISKYTLDKFLIFDDRSFGIAENLRKFSYYSATGALTTAIFWATELAFAIVSDHKAARYLGAIIGLLVGYVIKFQLDFRYIFRVKA